ncbi:hypothetical protein KEM60_00188 [Austwickia sp. TVS 96-490-7B]|uniref:polysaccharide deacetylase family protein n=1 Tax=Austwickia sp. TVS 96-490-7B TaxID=2830843 RepID=UPI001C597283|nr:polysaccharide deacetylase family protein [Austwickia sp. TVS 96-490-7B]MBW3084005.1 hypothetical protein [Austwickia sp. TVS 96-490-7B]
MRRRLPAFLLCAALAASTAACSVSEKKSNVPAAQSGQAMTRSQPVNWAGGGPDEVLLSGDSSQHLSHNDPALPASVRWPGLTGAADLDRTLADWAKGEFDRFLRSHKPSANNPPELSAFAVPILASGDVVGVRSETGLFGSGTHSQISHRTWYADTKSRQVWGATQLFDKDKLGDVWRLMMTSLTQSGHSPTTTKVKVDDTVRDMWFTDQGAVVMSLDQGTVLPLADGVKTVVLARKDTDPLLSAAGKQVRDATTKPTVYHPTSPTSGSTTTPGNSTPNGAISPTPSGTPTPVKNSTDCAVAKCVALTFDDGPGPQTNQLLDTLEHAGVKATFFVVGQSVAAAPEVVRREIAMGMAVGNHTWDHRQLTELNAVKQQNEVDRTNQLLQSIIGTSPTMMRPPYGAFNAKTRALGSSIVLWDVDTEDWKNRNTAVTTRRALATARNGSIILMHDVHPSTINAVPGIIAGLKQRGFTLVTVPELLGTMTPGKAYFSRGNIT